MRKPRNILLFLLFVIVCFVILPVNTKAGTILKTVANVIDYVTKAKTVVASTECESVDEAYGTLPKLRGFSGSNGEYHVAYDDVNNLYIETFDSNMQQKETITVKKELSIFGNITTDSEGNYYVVYGQKDGTDNYSSGGSATVLIVAKYTPYGNKVASTTYTGAETVIYNSDMITTETGFCTRFPFSFGQCDLIINSNGILTCFYGRVMYNGHQSSTAFFIDTKTMLKINYTFGQIPYTSHSFNQQVIETANGGYLFATLGDAYERGITLTRAEKNMSDLNYFLPFHCRSGYIYQQTYAKIGGIAELSNGYALVGCSENKLVYSQATNGDFNEARNIFIQVVNKNFTDNDTNSSSAQILSGSTRTAIDTSDSYVEHGLQYGSIDYGVVWLTNYTGNETAKNVKVTKISDTQLLIMWEADEYKNMAVSKAYYMIVNQDGSIAKSATFLPEGINLTYENSIVYQNGYLYWTTSEGDNILTTHRFQPLDDKAVSYSNGDEIVKNKMTFKITDTDAKSVKLVSVGSSLINITIPDSVNIYGDTYKVTAVSDHAFDACNKVNDIINNSSLTVLLPTLDGGDEFYFGGWCDSQGKIVTKIAPKETVTAYKITETVTVTFDSKGGSPVPAKTAFLGGYVKEPTAPTRAGYTFGGWYSGPSLYMRWSFKEDHIQDDITLYAKWVSIVKPTVKPKKITLSKNKVTLGVKETYTIKTKITPSNTNTNKVITFTSSKPKTAKVNKKTGKITALRIGSAIITARTANGKKATIHVSVKKAPTKISASKKKISLKKGKTYTLKYYLSKGSASRKVTFVSNKKSVATVNLKGKIIAKKRGKAIITLKTYNGKKAEISIIVK